MDNGSNVGYQSPKEQLNNEQDYRDRSKSDIMDRKSRILRLDDQERKPENTRPDRSSRLRDDPYTVTEDQSSGQRTTGISDHSTNPSPRMERSAKGRDDSKENIGGSGQGQYLTARQPVSNQNQGRDIQGNRPRTPDGPRNNLDSVSPSQRASNHRDLQPTRTMRYDPPRPNIINPRPAQGFRAPPPTGPRASVISGMAANTQMVNASRQQHLGRTGGTNEPMRATNTFPIKPSLVSERIDASMSPSTSSIAGINPEKPSMPRQSSRNVQNEPSKVQQTSLTVSESRSTRSHASQSDISNPSLQNDSAQATETPRGPSDWRSRPKRDLQDDDPLRLSRGPDNWADEGEEFSRPARALDVNVRSTRSKRPESREEVSTLKARTTQQREEKDNNESQRTSRDPHDKIEVSEGRRTRTPIHVDVNDRDSTSRTRLTTSANSQQERLRQSTTSQSKSTGDSAREGKEFTSRDQKENQPVERRGVHRDVTSREQKDLASKEQKLASHRDDETMRRRDDREASSRARREEPRESRHDRPREGHHGRISSRRSPSRTRDDRGDKRDKDRESDRRNGSRRESRELEHREKEKPRELEHRRDAHERDRSTRERDTENRRGSRKHEREKSTDALDRGSRSGDTVDSPGTGDSSLPNKRRRVGR